MSPRSFLCTALLRLLVAAAVLGTDGQAGRADPSVARAVVRMPSHGASATVIATAPGKSYLLSCGHAFTGGDRGKPIVIDAPTPSPAAGAKQVGIRLVDVDYVHDLSLIEMNDGPLDYVCPVAPVGHAPDRRLLSVGYDEMRLPATERAATLLGSAGGLTYTVERPWHGRSGGALIDVQAGQLVGVVSGYEVTGARRGLYVSHAAILRFLRVPGEKGDSPPSFRGLSPLSPDGSPAIRPWQPSPPSLPHLLYCPPGGT